MTTIKPPVVFKAEMFEYPCPTPNHTVTCEGAAHIANEILSQRLKTFFAVKSRPNSPNFVISGHSEPLVDTHVFFCFDPIEIPKPPVKKEIKEITARINLHGNIVGMSEDLSYLKGTPVKITVEEL